MMVKKLPDEFIKWAFDGRRELLKKELNGELEKKEAYLGFSKHSPAVITNGPAGLNASIKGIGFLPREDKLSEILELYMEHINQDFDKDYPQEGLKLLLNNLYCPDCKDYINFSLLGTLELAKNHTWKNIRSNKETTILFYQPPRISYELRCVAEIHQDDIIHKFLNAQHDMYHRPRKDSWEEIPAYLFKINEIYDNSATDSGYGRKIY